MLDVVGEELHRRFHRVGEGEKRTGAGKRVWEGRQRDLDARM
jgi:hypothetical protein